ncbi:Pepsin A [Vanrija pseudolonga]|uniref:Pepsin A n=1 Tax=Vanrija pseudolonga TaxID=143232 RepID=A0AAF0YD21_9TREE|nr:Pepsin A [Vanrija pseudolonga]
MYFARQNDSAFAPPSFRSQNGGVLTLGGLNTDLFVGEINYIPLSRSTVRNNSHFFWEIPLDHAEYGGRQFSMSTVAIVDTGNPFSTVPADLFRAIYGSLPGAVLSKTDEGRYTFPCSSADAQLRPLTVTLNGLQYTIPPEDLAFRTSASSETCISGLDPMDDRYP